MAISDDALNILGRSNIEKNGSRGRYETCPYGLSERG
jgi:hypothetical protein